MDTTKNLIMDTRQVNQRVDRIAYQIYEDNYTEKEVIIVGIKNKGYKLATKITDALTNICKLNVTLIALTIDKKNQLNDSIAIEGDIKNLKGKSVILVDDVLNSGKTMAYSLKALLDTDVKKIRTALLVDRDHKRYPVMANFVGMSLNTTLQEHILVDFGKQTRVYLS
jgi:pyrimidine operon attenuation protein / uracil phosphoribosyltransferase